MATWLFVVSLPSGLLGVTSKRGRVLAKILYIVARDLWRAGYRNLHPHPKPRVAEFSRSDFGSVSGLLLVQWCDGLSCFLASVQYGK